MKMSIKTANRPCLHLKSLRYFLSSFILAVSLTSNAQAIPNQVINLTVTYYTTPSWVHDNGFEVYLFETPSNMWPGGRKDRVVLAHLEGPLITGRSAYELSVPVTDLSNVYMQLDGSFHGYPIPDVNPYNLSVFVAEPPTGWVSDFDAWSYGPPWISLANVASGFALSGDLKIINGSDSQAGISHPWVVGTWEVTSVPEPSSLLLVGAGLSGFGLATWRRRRQS